MTNRPKYPVNTIERTIKIIDYLKENRRAAVTELAEEVRMAKSGVHNYLKTLESEGYVVQEPDQRYRLGLRFLDIGGRIRKEMEIFKESEQELSNLAERTGELTNLLTEEHGEGIYIYRAKGTQAVDLDTHSGFRTPLTTTALGKAILAHITESRVEEIVETHGLPQRTENTITDKEELFNELSKIRERGYAVDDEERLKGVRCVAAPIKTPGGQVLGAASISAPTSRMEGSLLEEKYPQEIKRTTNVIELNINYE